MADALVLVSCADSGELHALRLHGDSGRLSPLQVLALGGQLMPMARQPDGQRLWLARRSAPLAAIALQATPGAAAPLQLLGETSLPASMAHLATDRTGRWLFGASYGDNLVSVQAIGADGLARPAAQLHPTGRHAHAVAVHPGNAWVLATALGADCLHRWRFDAATGVLQADAPATVALPVGTGPRHLCFAADGAALLVLGELDARLHVLAFDASNGALQLQQSLPTLPPRFGGTPWAADLQLHPNGRWLYTSDRGSHTLAGFARHPSSNQWQPMGHWPTQGQPRGFAISPDGAHLVVAGQTSHALGVHAVNPHSGALHAVAESAVGANPNWVELLPWP